MPRYVVGPATSSGCLHHQTFSCHSLCTIISSQISTVYFGDQILILFGSCMLAAAVEEYSLHRRLALTILRRTGNSPYRLVLGKNIFYFTKARLLFTSSIHAYHAPFLYTYRFSFCHGIFEYVVIKYSYCSHDGTFSFCSH